MSATFIGRYHVADGYAGGSRPQTFCITLTDLEEDMTDRDLEKLFEDLMHEHFNEFICPEEGNQDEFVEWAKEQLSKRED